MKIIVLTQEEYLYLPAALGKVCEELRDSIECVVILPAMSTHGGAVRGFVRVARLFGLRGFISLSMRVMKARLLNVLSRAGSGGPFYSVRAAARAHGVSTRKVAKLNGPQFDSIISEHSADTLISISCPQIVGKSVRSRFSRGCINVHSSPLPHYRGLMPAFWILRNGETETAVTVHELGAKLDDGDILLQQKLPVSADETWDSLVRKTKSAGADLLLEAIRKIEAGTATQRPNLEREGSYYGFPTAGDRKIFQAKGRRFF